MIANAVIVSGGQQRDSAVHMHVFNFPPTPLPSRHFFVLQSIDLSPLGLGMVTHVLLGSIMFLLFVDSVLQDCETILFLVLHVCLFFLSRLFFKAR